MAKTPGATVETGGDDAILATAKKQWERCRDWWNENQRRAEQDLRFGRLGEQWPQNVKRDRELAHRPCLTFNKFPAFIRQVVNDGRQNKPQINFHPVDSVADPETADVLNGLVRQIEQSSNADIAYDTALDFAVTMGIELPDERVRRIALDAADRFDRCHDRRNPSER
jgi:hypothetical protein